MGTPSCTLHDAHTNFFKAKWQDTRNIHSHLRSIHSDYESDIPNVSFTFNVYLKLPNTVCLNIQSTGI